MSGGGRIAQIYAIRQAVARAVVAYYQKYVDEQSKQEIKVCSRQRLQLEGSLVPQLERQLLRVRARPKKNKFYDFPRKMWGDSFLFYHFWQKIV